MLAQPCNDRLEGLRRKTMLTRAFVANMQKSRMLLFADFSIAFPPFSISGDGFILQAYQAQFSSSLVFHSGATTVTRPVMKRMLFCKMVRITSISSSLRGPYIKIYVSVRPMRLKLKSEFSGFDNRCFSPHPFSITIRASAGAR